MRRTPSRHLLVLAVLALVLTACTGRGADPVPDGLDGPGGTGVAGDAVSEPADGTAAEGADRERRVRLRASTSCEDLLAFYVEGASDLVGPYGLGGGVLGVPVLESAADASVGGAVAVPAAGGDASLRQDVAQATAGGVSGTNTQEEGVDEPDVVKTDGRVIVTALDGRVRVVDVAAGAVASTIELPDDTGSAELLLDGTTLLILSTSYLPGTPRQADLVPAFPAERTTVTRVDLTDPANPVTLGSLRMEGTYRSARLIDGTVRFVVVSTPTGLAFTQPTDGGLAAEADAEQANREILAASEIDDWIPHHQLLDADGRAAAPQRALDCTQISQPAELAGLQTLSVLTFDLRGDGIAPTSGAGLVAAGDTVYASTDRLVVATSPWGGWAIPFIDAARIAPPEPQDLSTDLHTFDITDRGATRYVASGRVQGTLIGQFALDEAGGIIRVATTTTPAWGGGAGGDSQSSLVTLAEQGEQLVERGRVDGLGVTEQIQAVRYLTPTLAAIVTFRQVDPLYLVDTTDPANPVVRGELKVPGFSSYLHPIGEGYLLGIGQDADEATGRTLGVQASLFDIRDLANPQRVAQVTFGQGWSAVESDHRAFLHWPATGQAVIPLELYGYTENPDGTIVERPEDTFAGAAVLQVGEGTLAEQGRITTRDLPPGTFAPGIVRSLVIGDDLWTVGYDGLARHDLATLQREATVPLS